MLGTWFLTVIESRVLLNNVLEIDLWQQVVWSVPSVQHYWREVHLDILEGTVGWVRFWTEEIGERRMTLWWNRRIWLVLSRYDWLVIGNLWLILHLFILVGTLLLLVDHVLVEKIHNVDDIFWLEYVSNDHVLLHFGSLSLQLRLWLHFEVSICFIRSKKLVLACKKWSKF